MRKNPVLFIVFALLLLFVSPLSILADVNLTILHTNDIHGQINPLATLDPKITRGGFPALKNVFMLERARAYSEGSHLLQIDCGDIFQGTPMGDFTRGTGIFKLMKKMGYDLGVPGNHDFDISYKELKKKAKLLGYPMICANLFLKSGKRPKFLKPYVIKEIDGVRIAFIGSIIYQLHTLTLPSGVKNLIVKKPEEVLPALISKLRNKDKVQLVVLVSHSGIMEDRAVAQAVNGIDIIIGGHSHTAMVKPDIINNTLLYQAGSKSQYVGRIKLELDEKTGKINKHFFKLIEVKESVHGRNLAMKRLVDRISAPIMEPLLKPVGHTDKTLVKVSGPVSTDEKIAEVKETKATSPWGIELLQLPGNKWFITETNLSQIVCDSFAEAAGVPIAFTNLAGIRAGMLPGPIDRLMVYKTLPFQNYIWVLSMKGKDITELFNMGKDLYSGPFLQSCGLEIRYKVTGDSIALSSISHQGKILDPEASYDVCTNNFLAAGGDGFAAFTKAKLVKKTDILLRDAFEKYIKSRKVIAPVITPRILFER